MLENLRIGNFKGIRNLDFSFKPGINEGFGKNGTGKTTLVDAFRWLLTGKDSKGRADYELKPREIDDVEHGVETFVEARFDDVTLKRVYFEVWKKKKGAIEKTFSGNTTDYFINGEKLEKESEWIDFIKNKFGSEDDIKLLVDVFFFAETMHWKERREIVFDVAGEKRDDEIIAEMQFPGNVPELIKESNVDEAIAKLKKRAETINKELEELRIRRDEAKKSIPEKIDSEEKERLLNEISRFDKLINAEESRLHEISESRELKENLHQKRMELRNKLDEDSRTERRYKDEHERAVSNLKANIQIEERNLNNILATMKELERDLDGLRAVGKSILEKKFDAEKEKLCFNCGKPIDADKLQELEEKFNHAKAEELKPINKAGISKKERLENLRKDENPIREKLKEYSEKLFAIKAPEFQKKEYPELIKEIEELEKAVSGESLKVEELKKPIREKISELRKEQDFIREKLSSIRATEKNQERIIQIEKEQSEKSSKYESIMIDVKSLEDFIMKKVEMIETDVLRAFGVKFKMFEKHISGGISACCEPLILVDKDWIPFSTLNNAGRISTGLKLIDVLQKHYKCRLPVFVDNSEGILEFPDVDLQIIKLAVSKDFNKITFK